LGVRGQGSGGWGLVIMASGSGLRAQVAGLQAQGLGLRDLIAVSVYDKHSVGPSIRTICTRCCFTMTDMIQVCSSFHEAPAFMILTRPDENRA